jgi:hypothetical protein
MTTLWNISGTQSNNISVLEPMVKQVITCVVRFLSIKEQVTEPQHASIFINAIFGADAYQRGNTNRVVYALLEVKVPTCELAQHGSLNVIKATAAC